MGIAFVSIEHIERNIAEHSLENVVVAHVVTDTT